MLYGRKRKSYSARRPRRTMRKRVYRKRSALTVAKQALTLAKKTMMSATETKYLSRVDDTDIAGVGALYDAAYSFQVTDLSGFSPIFGTDGVTGNKSFLKYIKANWEVHMDNVNNEEETVNFTLVVWKPRADFDQLSTSTTPVVYTANGQPFFNPRLVKVIHKRYFTLTMGGTSPGTAGESRRYGQFYIPVNKMIRYSPQGITGQQTGIPSSYQDRIYISWYSDNSATDTESPRLNMHTMTCYRDIDVNH